MLATKVLVVSISVTNAFSQDELEYPYSTLEYEKVVRDSFYKIMNLDADYIQRQEEARLTKAVPVGVPMLLYKYYKRDQFYNTIFDSLNVTIDQLAQLEALVTTFSHSSFSNSIRYHLGHYYVHHLQFEKALGIITPFIQYAMQHRTSFEADVRTGSRILADYIENDKVMLIYWANFDKFYKLYGNVLYLMGQYQEANSVFLDIVDGQAIRIYLLPDDYYNWFIPYCQENYSKPNTLECGGSTLVAETNELVAVAQTTSANVFTKLLKEKYLDKDNE